MRQEERNQYIISLLTALVLIFFVYTAFKNQGII